MPDEFLDNLLGPERPAPPNFVSPKAHRQPPAGPTPATSSSPEKDQPIARVRYSHEALIDLMLIHPTWTQNQLAEATGYTPAWLSQIINSDVFKSKYAERRAQIVDPEVAKAIEVGINSSFDETIRRSQELLLKRLSGQVVTNVPDNLLLRSLEISARARGYGARDQAPPVENNIHLHLEDLAGNMTALLKRKREAVTIEQEPTNVK